MKMLQMLIFGLFYFVVSLRSANKKGNGFDPKYKIKYKAIKNMGGMAVAG